MLYCSLCFLVFVFGLRSPESFPPAARRGQRCPSATEGAAADRFALPMKASAEYRRWCSMASASGAGVVDGRQYTKIVNPAAGVKQVLGFGRPLNGRLFGGPMKAAKTWRMQGKSRQPQKDVILRSIAGGYWIAPRLAHQFKAAAIPSAKTILRKTVKSERVGRSRRKTLPDRVLTFSYMQVKLFQIATMC